MILTGGVGATKALLEVGVFGARAGHLDSPVGAATLSMAELEYTGFVDKLKTLDDRLFVCHESSD